MAEWELSPCGQNRGDPSVYIRWSNCSLRVLTVGIICVHNRYYHCSLGLVVIIKMTLYVTTSSISRHDISPVSDRQANDLHTYIYSQTAACGSGQSFRLLSVTPSDTPAHNIGRYSYVELYLLGGGTPFQ